MTKDADAKAPSYKVISGLIIAAIILFGPIGLVLVAIFRKEWIGNKLVLVGLCAWSLSYCISFLSGVKDGATNYGNTQDEGVIESPSEASAEEQETTSIAEIDITCAKDKVRNDTTGKWKIATTASTTVVSDYTADYYKKCFEDDSEIHAVVNFTLKTTTKFTKVGPWVNVTTYEYVEKEEHDANKLFGGMVLVDKYYDAETGEEVTDLPNDDKETSETTNAKSTNTAAKASSPATASSSTAISSQNTTSTTGKMPSSSSTNKQQSSSASPSSPADTNANENTRLPLKAICNDGAVSYQDNPELDNYKGMCSSHQGIKEKLGRVP